MLPYALMTVLPLFLLIAMVVAQQVGIRLRRRGNVPKEELEGLSGIDAAVFGLMGLLLAFTFSGAASRFDERRTLVIQEANDIGTAWLRIDLLATADQGPMRQLFRDYLDSRIRSFSKAGDLETFRKARAVSSGVQAKIWALAVPASQRGAASAQMLLLPSLNDMFDTADQRAGVMLVHVPGIILGLLAIVMVLCQVLAGYRVADSGWANTHRLAFAVILAVTFYVIIDLEFPRLGFVRVDDIDQILYQLRKSMG